MHPVCDVTCISPPRLYSEYNLKNLRKWATSENYCLAMPALTSNAAAVMRTDNIHQHVILSLVDLPTITIDTSVTQYV